MCLPWFSRGAEEEKGKRRGKRRGKSVLIGTRDNVFLPCVGSENEYMTTLRALSTILAPFTTAGNRKLESTFHAFGFGAKVCVVSSSSLCTVWDLLYGYE
jgi:hypothetical protein